MRKIRCRLIFKTVYSFLFFSITDDEHQLKRNGFMTGISDKGEITLINRKFRFGTMICHSRKNLKAGISSRLSIQSSSNRKVRISISKFHNILLGHVVMTKFTRSADKVSHMPAFRLTDTGQVKSTGLHFAFHK